MSVRQFTATVPASGVLNLEPANFIFIYSTTANLSLQFQSKANETFSGVGAGLRIQRRHRWDTINLKAASGTVLSLLYGFQEVLADDTAYQSTIATLSGTVSVSQVPRTAAPTDHADVVVAAGTTDSTIAANTSRQSIIIGSLSNNAPGTPVNLRVRGDGDVVGGIELQPGTSITLYTQAAIDIYNGDTNNQTYWWQEQT